MERNAKPAGVQSTSSGTAGSAIALSDGGGFAVDGAA
jgi:hypothetical protein